MKDCQCFCTMFNVQLINAKPITTSLKDFFASSLSHRNFIILCTFKFPKITHIKLQAFAKRFLCRDRKTIRWVFKSTIRSYAFGRLHSCDHTTNTGKRTYKVRSLFFCHLKKCIILGTRFSPVEHSPEGWFPPLFWKFVWF